LTSLQTNIIDITSNKTKGERQIYAPSLSHAFKSLRSSWRKQTYAPSLLYSYFYAQDGERQIYVPSTILNS